MNPRAITDAERPWLDAWSLDTQARLIELVRERRSNVVAFGVAGWLSAKHAGLADMTGSPRRASYRKLLAELAAEGLVPDPTPAATGTRSLAAARARRRSQSGAASTLLPVAMMLFPVAVALAGRSPVLGAIVKLAAENVWNGEVTSSEPGDELARARTRLAQGEFDAGRHVSDTRLGPQWPRVEHVAKAA